MEREGKYVYSAKLKKEIEKSKEREKEKEKMEHKKRKEEKKRRKQKEEEEQRQFVSIVSLIVIQSDSSQERSGANGERSKEKGGDERGCCENREEYHSRAGEEE